MPTLDDLQSSNGSFSEQMTAWRQQRYADGENPLDWTAFRRHLLTIGAPDPGETPPDEFYRWDESLIGGQPGPAARRAESPPGLETPEAPR
jgi:hypothetical protein